MALLGPGTRYELQQTLGARSHRVDANEGIDPWALDQLTAPIRRPVER